MNIGDKTIDICNVLLGRLLNEHKDELNEAYLKAEDSLDVSLKLKISPITNGNKVKADLSFVAEKIKDSVSGEVSEDQMVLGEDFERT